MRSRSNSILWLLLPFFLFFGIFWMAPLIGAVHISVHSNALFGEPDFLGLDNYRSLIDDNRFRKAINNTLRYTLATMLVIVPMAILLSSLLHRAWPRLKPLLSFVLLLPGLTPPAVLALLFLLVFHGRNGFLNQWFVVPFGFAPINWLKDPSWIMPALVIQATWRWVGFITFFILAGRESLPKTYYEVASLETGRRWPVFSNVTFPMLQHVIVFACIYLIVDAFAMFSGAYVLLGGSGGTADAGLLLINYGYQVFSFAEFGTSAAISLAVAPALLGMLALFFFRFRRNEI